MPQLQNLVLTDRAGTPVNHTFTPRDIRDGVGTVIESSGVPIGNSRFSVALRKTPSGKYKATLSLAVPVVQSQDINGITSPVVVRSSFVNCEFSFDEKSTTQERDDAVGMFMSALDSSKTLVDKVVVDLEGVY